MRAPLAFTDVETTGLTLGYHEIWEAATIIRRDGQPEEQYVWQLPVDMERADPVALRIGNFYERRHERKQDLIRHRDFAAQFAKLTEGCHMVGACVSFDDARLSLLLQANGATPKWHYHLVDVEAMAAGHIGAVRVLRTITGENPIPDLPSPHPPWNSETLSRAVGVEPNDFPRHTAMGDCQWAAAIYDACTPESA